MRIFCTKIFYVILAQFILLDIKLCAFGAECKNIQIIIKNKVIIFSNFIWGSDYYKLMNIAKK